MQSSSYCAGESPSFKVSGEVGLKRVADAVSGRRRGRPAAGIEQFVEAPRAFGEVRGALAKEVAVPDLDVVLFCVQAPSLWRSIASRREQGLSEGGLQRATRADAFRVGA